MNTNVKHLNVYTVEEYDAPTKENKNTKARNWTKIGAAFPHKEGPGFNIELRAIPLNGRLVVLPPSEESEQRDPPAANRRR